MTHKLDKDLFLKEMEKRGWKIDEPTHTWLRPLGRTQAEAEKNWIDAILASISCPLERHGGEMEETLGDA